MDRAMTAKDILVRIKKKYDLPEWITLTEVVNDDGSSIRRADAIALNLWASRGYAVHGFEIKVSRSDFLAEMKDITKSEAFSKSCDYWWLAAPKGLVSPTEIPESWGLMEFTALRSCITKYAQKKQDPEPIGRSFLASLIRRAVSIDEQEIRSKVDAVVKKERERIAKLEMDLIHEMREKTKRAMEKNQEKYQTLGRFAELIGSHYMTERGYLEFLAKYKMAQVLDSSLLDSAFNRIKEIEEIKNKLKGME